MTFPGCGGNCGFCPCTARAVVEDGTVVRVEWSCDGGETWGTEAGGYGFYDCSRCLCDDFGPTPEDPTVLELPGGAIIHLANAVSYVEGECQGTVYATVAAGGSGYTDGTFPIPYPHRDAECPCEGNGPGTCCDHCSNPRCYAQDCANIATNPPALQMRVKMNANFFRVAEHYDANPEFFDSEDMPPNMEFVCALPCGTPDQAECENGRCLGGFGIVIERDPQTDASEYDGPCFRASREALVFAAFFGTQQGFNDTIIFAQKCQEDCTSEVYLGYDELFRPRRCWFWMSSNFWYYSRSYLCVDTECINPITGLPYIDRSTMPDRTADVYSYVQCMTRETNGCPRACKLPLNHIASNVWLPADACYDDCTLECAQQGQYPPVVGPYCDYYCKQSKTDDLLDSAYGIWIEPYEAGTVCCESYNSPGFDDDVIVETFAETVTSLSFSAVSIAANAPRGTSAGTLSANVEATWRLACGPGDDDNAKFRIDGTTVRSASSLPAGTYSVRVRAKAANRATREQSFNVTVS